MKRIRVVELRLPNGDNRKTQILTKKENEQKLRGSETEKKERKKFFERQRLSQLIHRDYKHYFGISLGIIFFSLLMMIQIEQTSEYIWSILLYTED